MSRRTLILGIETSCDETAAAVVDSGRRILSSVTFSQAEVHHRYGGIVPELAGREHIQKIVPAVGEALDQAGVETGDLAAVGASTSPGLLGALLVGVSFGKALSWSIGIPLIAVNHLEGHILSIFLCRRRPAFPFTALVVSGGHTSLYLVGGYNKFQLLGRTRDDAAGEAFDKVAKFLGLGYPGGPVLESYAREGNPGAIPFPRPWISKGSLDFSFSGLKTAVVNYLRREHGYRHQGLGPAEPYLPRETLADIAASFQAAVVDVLVGKALMAAESNGCRHLSVSGGVAANSRLRKAFRQAEKEVTVLFPPPALCTDNAAMIAGAAHYRFREGLTSDLFTDASARDRTGRTPMLSKETR